jgi:hypothetical protein
MVFFKNKKRCYRLRGCAVQGSISRIGRAIKCCLLSLCIGWDRGGGYTIFERMVG